MKEHLHLNITEAREELELATVDGDRKKIAVAHQKLLEALAQAQTDQKQKTAEAGK